MDVSLPVQELQEVNKTRASDKCSALVINDSISLEPKLKVSVKLDVGDNPSRLLPVINVKAGSLPVNCGGCLQQIVCVTTLASDLFSSSR